MLLEHDGRLEFRPAVSRGGHRGVHQPPGTLHTQYRCKCNVVCAAKRARASCVYVYSPRFSFCF